MALKIIITDLLLRLNKCLQYFQFHFRKTKRKRTFISLPRKISKKNEPTPIDD